MTTDLAARDRRCDRLARLLFHLGKGLWKAVPLVGPIVEEVIFEQYRDELLRKLGSYAPHELDRLERLLLSRDDLQKLENSVAKWSDEQRVRFGGLAVELLGSLDGGFAHIDARFDALMDGVGGIRELLTEVLGKVVDAEQLRQIMERLNERRRSWRQRISHNQRLLLGAIPREYARLEHLWAKAGDMIPGCGYKEFRFRLHELEWLDLVDRRRGPDGWEYRRLDGEEGTTDG